MKKTSLGLWCLLAWCSVGFAQERVYRCGNEYTNNPVVAKERNCQPLEGGNVTVIQSSGTRATPPSRPAAAPAQASSASSASRVADTAQRSRDADARAILEAELKKSEERLAALQTEYNDGYPVRTALELRNPQGYLERTAELKANIERTQADIESIRREIARQR
ncbi:hypothetical protein D8I35_02525 [Corticibacter populi]|uniref:DUF4124 domain-containing protein n=1 Tax=Corticibacter populi TaxID=1550736 RepID=A0A3M6QYC7_9BURK|nr:hypothetical protein [Corticibacter populi]RMX08020.1 hypothetical protein D8I35_02525 [Corticibacter populi]